MTKIKEFKQVYVSIITIPVQETIEVGDDTFLRFKSTYSEHKEYINDKQVLQSYFDDAGKSVAFAKILQINVGYVNEGEIRVNILKGDEANIIAEFHKILKSDYFKNAKLYGYNNSFLYDIVRFRARVNKISAEVEAPSFKDIVLQPWKRNKSICLMEETVSSFRGKISYINAIYAAGLNYQNIIPGEDIYSYYSAGKTEEIDLSCNAYIKGLVNLHRFLDTENEISQLVSNVSFIGEVEKEEINVLDHILSSGQLSSKVLEALKVWKDENNESGKNILDLVVAALSNNGAVSKEDIELLKETLDLAINYDAISCVKDKGNLGKKQADELIKLYRKESVGKKQQIIELVEQYLTEYGKIGQVTAKKSLEFLKDNL